MKKKKTRAGARAQASEARTNSFLSLGGDVIREDELQDVKKKRTLRSRLHDKVKEGRFWAFFNSNPIPKNLFSANHILDNKSAATIIAKTKMTKKHNARFLINKF